MKFTTSFNIEKNSQTYFTSLAVATKANGKR